jgi:hypothetical protein
VQFNYRAFFEAVQALPPKVRGVLEARDPSLFAFYGLGIMPNSAQEQIFRDLLAWAVSVPGAIHVLRWANRTGKTTGLTLFYYWAIWYKWRYQSSDPAGWFGFHYRVLHAAPLSALTEKVWELGDAINHGTAKQQQSPITHRQRKAWLAPFYTAEIHRGSAGVDRPIVRSKNNGQIDLLSTHDGAARMESEAWWVLGWDEFPRQQPADDIPVIFDQTLLPRQVDFDAPIILAGTATIDSELAYMDIEELAKENPGDWNFTEQARSANFAMSHQSAERQVRLSIDKQVAQRSVFGKFGEGSGELFPHFVLDNAFTDDLPERTFAPATENDWQRFLENYAYWQMFDHALGGDDNVIQTWAVPWPAFKVSIENPIRAHELYRFRSSRSLTHEEQQGYLAERATLYRPRGVIIDSTAEGGLMAYRSARARGLPVIDCNFAGRAVKFTSNKEFGIQALQRLLGYGLPFQGSVEGIVSEWPKPAGPFGLLKFPKAWTRLHRQLATLKRDDAKLRQDEAMTTVMGAWHLWKLLPAEGSAALHRPQRFNVMSVRGRR